MITNNPLLLVNRLPAALTVYLLHHVFPVSAHEHHGENIPEGEAISADPIDSILWLHILVQVLAWGIIYPTGMVLGIIRSKWHVPVQVVGTSLAVLGYFLGHLHKGRQFAPNIHAKFANILMIFMIVQVILGAYLRGHLERGFQGRMRWILVLAHGINGKMLPVLAWVQMIFGGIVALGFCHRDHLGQCIAHFIMGSAFIGYGIVLTILLLVGQSWIRRKGRSQEFYDSSLIAAWGCVNTFTEHRWGSPWGHNDLQHTSMGIIWWCAGLVGLWLSRDKAGRPKRNLIPAIVIFITGWAMSGHPQHLEISTKLHSVFGYTLMGAGLTRIIEISFVLKDKDSYSKDGNTINSFQYLCPFLLYASGFLFMGATEEQMALLATAQVSHVSYILILYSVAFVMFLFVNMLLHLYEVGSTPADSKDYESTGMPNGHANSAAGHQRIRDAEEFELDGLMTDDDEDDHRKSEGAFPQS